MVLNAGLRLAAQPDAPRKGCSGCLPSSRLKSTGPAPPPPCPAATRTITILSGLWAAPRVRTSSCRKMISPRLRWPKRLQGQAQAAVYQLLFTLAEDWDEELLSARSAARAKALPGVNRHPKPRFNPKGFGFLGSAVKVCLFRAFGGICTALRPQKAFRTVCFRFPAFFRKFLQKDFTNHFQNILGK